jgi:hypothetical protein
MPEGSIFNFNFDLILAGIGAGAAAGGNGIPSLAIASVRGAGDEHTHARKHVIPPCGL